MQLLVQICLDPSRATEIFSVPKQRIFALPKIVRYRNKSGLQYITMLKCEVGFIRATSRIRVENTDITLSTLFIVVSCVVAFTKVTTAK